MDTTRLGHCRGRQAPREWAATVLGAASGPCEKIVRLLRIGLTLLLAWQPWLVLAAVPLHSAVNLLAVRLMRISLPLTEALVAVVGVAAFALGLACQ
ncbi:hypothetical protein [Streptosporangium sp. NPDC000396]|uniref:hypothetical protein n=1 Tax=Streptosporangium sp. NPDC000396 TaxID=3366185 RepID=UPI0036BD2D34